MRGRIARWLLAVCLAQFLLSGCTSQTWREKSTYPQVIQGFFVVEAQSLLVAVGTDYSYVFDVDANLLRTLTDERELLSDAAVSVFNLKRNNEVSGLLALYANSTALAVEQQAVLEDLEFRRYSQKPVVWHDGSDRGDYRRRLRLSGKRYRTEEGSELEQMSKPLIVFVSQPDGPAEVAGKIAVTPGTVAFDAAATAIMLPLGLTFKLLGGAD